MPEANPIEHSQARVLVVEDDGHVCELVAEVLESEGLEPRCVQNGEAAYRALRAEPAFACMIVDVNLGTGVTGYDVARFARELDPTLPVIFVSGQTSERSFKANGVPASLFVPKPFTGAELMGQLRRLVGDNDDAA